MSKIDTPKDFLQINNEITSIFAEYINLADKKDPSFMYSKTKKILELYKICVWCLNSSTRDIEKELGYITQSDPIFTNSMHLYKTLLQAAQQCNFNLHETWIPGRIRSMSKTAALLDYSEKTLLSLRSYPYGGETYYQILYLNYFDISQTKNTGINLLAIKKLGYSSEPSYYKHKSEAISLYGTIFWNIADQQIDSIIKE